MKIIIYIKLCTTEAINSYQNQTFGFKIQHNLIGWEYYAIFLEIKELNNFLPGHDICYHFFC